MAILTLRLPEVNFETTDRPTGCTYCGSSILQRWGKVSKPIRDMTGRRTIEIYRYRCPECRRTFRRYPEGISAAEQTDRLKAAAAMLWALGIGLRPATAVLGLFEVTLCHMTVWRDAIALADELARRRPPGLIPVLGVDGSGSRVGGRSGGIVVAVDMGTGHPVAVAQLDENDVEAMIDWLAPLVEEYGVEVLVTDDLNAYNTITKALHVDRQRCLFHFKRWTGNAIRAFRKSLPARWLPVLDEVAAIVEDMPPDGGYRLFELYHPINAPPPQLGEKATPLHRFRRMLIRLSDHSH